MKGFQKLSILLLLLLTLALPVRAECSHDYILVQEEPTCTEGGLSWM